MNTAKPGDMIKIIKAKCGIIHEKCRLCDPGTIVEVYKQGTDLLFALPGEKDKKNPRLGCCHVRGIKYEIVNNDRSFEF